MATKKKTTDWALALAPESTDHVRLDRILFWVSGALLVLTILVGLMDVADLFEDPTQHAIGQRSDADDEGWRSRYVSTGFTMIAGAVAALGLLLYCAKNPHKKWTSPILRVISAAIIGVVTIGYVSWARTGFDH